MNCYALARNTMVARLRVFAALVCALVLGSGCVQDAEMKVFKCNNPNDPNPSSNCDATTASTGTGLVTFVLVDTVQNVVVLLNPNTDTTVAPLTMSGWTIVNGDAIPTVWYTFISFSLASGAYVRVHGNTTGTDTSLDVYAIAPFSWSVTPPNHIATMKDGSGVVIAQCQSSQTTTCWQ